jgi:hypothetical protein
VLNQFIRWRERKNNTLSNCHSEQARAQRRRVDLSRRAVEEPRGCFYYHADGELFHEMFRTCMAGSSIRPNSWRTRQHNTLVTSNFRHQRELAATLC